MNTAYHEAAHAVADFHFGVAIKEVSIIPDEDSLGHVKSGKLPKGMEFGNVPRSRIEKEIICLLVGPAMDELLGDDDVRGQGDYQSAVKLAFYVTGSNEEAEAYLNWLWIRAKNFVRCPPHRVCIEALAQVLLKERRLSGRKARQIIREALMPSPS